MPVARSKPHHVPRAVAQEGRFGAAAPAADVPWWEAFAVTHAATRTANASHHGTSAVLVAA